MLLQNLKLYLEIDESDISKDNLLTLLIGMAQDIIKQYCNIDELDSTFDNAIVLLAAYLYSKHGNDAYNSVSQGARSVSFAREIPDFIKAILPLPKVRVV